MIQDIKPHKLNNAFAVAEAEPEHRVLTFSKRNILIWRDENGDMRLPRINQLPGDYAQRKEQAIYAFSIDDVPMFILLECDLGDEIPDDMEYVNLRDLYTAPDYWISFAAATAQHLNNWYEEHRYCGRCAKEMDFSVRERAMICPECKNIQYPRISPVVMAAVTEGDKILVTRYAGREYKGLALNAGFVEIGESLEGALKREVMEEVGLNVKNIRYFGSQPWGFSDSVISGFFVEVDGSNKVKLDRNELAEAIWISREEIPPQNTDISITSAMLEAFRTEEM